MIGIKPFLSSGGAGRVLYCMGNRNLIDFFALIPK